MIQSVSCQRQEPAVSQTSQNRDDLAEILNEIRSAHEQVGQLPTRAMSGISPSLPLVVLLPWARASSQRCSPRPRLKFGAAAAADVSRNTTAWSL
jgi:hypothetical protein